MRKSVIALTAGAVACAAVAGVIRFKMVPDAERVQNDQNTVVHYTGTATFLDQKALAGGDMAHAFAQNVPFTAVDTVKLASMHGNTAVLTDDMKIDGAGGALGNPHAVWAVDRKTLMPAPAPAGSGAADHQGLVEGFAFGPKKQDYPWWDGGTQTQATAKYVGTETHAGRTTYKYTVDVSGALKDPDTLASFPQAIPAGLLKALAQAVAPDQAALLGAVLPKGGDDTMVPLSYTAATKTTMWVDSTDGTTVDAQNEQSVTPSIKTMLGQTPLPVKVLDVTTKMSDQGIADAVKQAKDHESQLLWEGTVAPAALAVLAVALLGGAVVIGRRRGNASGAADATAVQPEAVDA